MQQAHGITSILIFAICASIFPAEAISKSNLQPVEIKSDPYGVGNPTKYSILRGNSKVTFSHPLAGQFTRSEIAIREKGGTRLTRFLLSRDRKTYHPVLSFLTPFEVHYSKKDEKICIAEPTALSTLAAIAPRAVDGELIAKKREELTKANFFETSCFDTNIPIEHRNAIMNAAADVLSTKTQDVTPEPKYLRCLEKFGFAHESGTIQALQKVSKSNPKDTCKLRLGCTMEELDEGQGQFDEASCRLTLQTTPHPERDDYARLIFHELMHSVPVRDGTPLAVIEACCVEGKQCDALRAFADQNRTGEKVITLLDSTDTRNAVRTSSATLVGGTDGDSAIFAPPNDLVESIKGISVAESRPTFTCRHLGVAKCPQEFLNIYSAVAQIKYVCVEKDEPPSGFNALILAALVQTAYAKTDNSKPTCNLATYDPHGMAATKELRLNKAINESRPITMMEAIEHLPQTSPITWDVPKEVTPIRLASTLPPDGPKPGQGTSTGNTPTRTIASIEPLPDVAPERQLGSMVNRRDVSTGRATVLVDTLERAARNVATKLTPEKIDLLEVDRNKIFQADYKPKTKSPQYLVTSSSKNPIQVADIGDIRGLSFPNPFADQLPTEKPASRLAKAEAGTATDARPVAATKTRGGSAEGRAAAGATISERDRDAADVRASEGASTVAAAASLTAAALRNSRAITQANILPTESREPSAASTLDFKSMDQAALIKFLTSSFRTVSTELENPKLAKALVDNRIQIHDHEKRQIGAMKPEVTLIYSSELGRLVQTRLNREKK